MTLPTTELGSTGMQITRIGFGGWAIGGYWGPQDDKDSLAAIERALELGLNWIDTAHAYGDGHSEALVGQAIKGAAVRPYVFTKCSVLHAPDGGLEISLKKDSIRREVEGSLERLGVDAIDLYQIHDANPVPDLDEGWSTLVELKEEGLVRHIGVSNFTAAQLAQIGEIAPVETLQPPFSLVDRNAEGELLDYCEGNDVGVIVYSPMASGLLTGRMSAERIRGLPDDDWRKKDVEFTDPKLDINLAIAERVKAMAAELGVAPGVVAIAWTLHHGAVDGAIVGLRNPGQIEDLIVAAGTELSDEQAATLVAG